MRHFSISRHGSGTREDGHVHLAVHNGDGDLAAAVAGLKLPRFRGHRTICVRGVHETTSTLVISAAVPDAAREVVGSLLPLDTASPTPFLRRLRERLPVRHGLPAACRAGV